LDSVTTNSTPSAAVSRDPLFKPLRLRHLTLKNRIMSTSHACGLEEGGLPKERYQRYHEEKAKGGLALTMFGGSSNIAPDSPNVFQQLNVGTDEILPYFLQFSERVHAHGAALMCQITHLGRRGDASLDRWLPTIAPSRVRETLHRNFPREMDEHDIKRVVEDFAAAAKRCKDGGLDGLETMAGGHLIGQFFAPDTNRRTDRFGGSIENRARFAIMVHEAIRKAVGEDFVAGMRFVVDEAKPGGLTFEEALAIARLLEREGSIDFFNCVFGRMDTELALAENNMPGMAMPLAPYLRQVADFKQQISLPVFHAARITDVATARHAISAGLLDMVAMTRAHIADPQIVNKIRAGQEQQIRPCMGVSHCMHKKPSCIHNPASGRETELPQLIARSQRPGRRVVVVGGGPGGLEAARVSALRGHQVVLFEAGPQLGGQILLAARASWRRDLIGIVDWRVSELERLGVDVHLNTYAEAADVLSQGPDFVVVASGGVPDVEWLDGAENCATVWEILGHTVAPGEDILIFDGTGRHEALSCADHLAAPGRKIVLVSRDNAIAAEMGYAERVIYRKRLYERGIDIVVDHRLAKVDRAGNKLTAVLVNELTCEISERQAGQIVIEHGTVPVDDVYRELRAQSRNDGVTDIRALIAGRPQPDLNGKRDGFSLHRIGDAAASRSIHAAIFDAYRLCHVL
jgi:2,4-dienoyl-CoA reductase-like NADH-dependent reductase (Old Yellow Enzyme family)